MTHVAADERVAHINVVRRLVARPEIGALLAAAAVFVAFGAMSETFRSPAGVANWLDPAATLGIMAVAVALLMIGGEFDLSAGVMAGTTGLTVGLLVTQLQVHVWLAVLLSLILAAAIGLFNGLLVIRSGLPSFIVTLATFLMLQGLNLGITKLVIGNVLVSGVAQGAGYSSAHAVFASSATIFGASFRVSILWWVGLTLAGTYLLLRTRLGNWIFAVGGNRTAARSVGVPVARTKVSLFVFTSVAGWLVGTMTVLRLTSMQANVGVGQELIFIVAAVIGGCLLTGGAGSVLGAATGALIFGMVEQGIVYVGWDSDWFKFFLGGMLLLAVFTNRMVRGLWKGSAR